jgi:hypothetical protein
MKYRSLAQTIRKMYEAKVEADANDQIAVGSYTTKAFEMSPEAQKLYMKFPKDKDVNVAQTIAVQLDRLFDLEKTTTSTETASPKDIDHARQIVDTVVKLSSDLGMEKEFEFIHKNMKNIEKYLAPDSTYAAEHPHPTEHPKFRSPPKHNLPDAKQNVQGPGDRDVDNTKNYAISRSGLAQRKIKIIDTD